MSGLISNELMRIAEELVGFGLETNLEKSLSKFHIKEYAGFVKFHDDEWICAPINRNANVPFIYVETLQGGMLVAGYTFLNKERTNENYDGVPQDNIVGLMEELAFIKKSIEELSVAARNELLDNENSNDDNAQENTEESTENENADDVKNENELI